MPLQIRRGPTADRENMVPLEGELVYDTELKSVYIGDNSTAGGLPVTSLSAGDVRSTTARQFLGTDLDDNSIHTGISFQVIGERLVATVNSSLEGAFKGSFFANDSSTIIDGQTGTIYGNFAGNVWADDSTGPLINGTNASVNLDGTVKGDVIPDESEAYDLGSETKRFKDLWLSGSSLFIGDAQITASGSALVLPSGTTVNGNPLGFELGVEYGIDVRGNLVGSVFADDSTFSIGEDSSREPLVDATSGKINLDGTVKGNIIPDGNETFNIGSLTNRFNRLYLSESAASLWIGNAVIGSTASAINLPAGSTVGGVPIGSGSSSGDGVIQGSTYKINIAAADSTLIVDSDNNRLIGNLAGDIYASDGTSLVLDSGTDGTDAAFTGTLNGNVFGNVTGNVTGNLNGNVNGNVTGNINGIITTSLIQSDDSSDIQVIQTTRFNSDLRVDENLFVTNETVLTGALTFSSATARTTDSTARYLTLEQNNDEVPAASLAFRRSRGTLLSQSPVQVDDALGDIDWNAYTGTQTLVGATIRATVGDTVTSGAIPTNLNMFVADGTGELQRRLIISHLGNVDIFGGLNQTLAFAGGAPAILCTQNFDDTVARALTFARGRGTSNAPAELLVNDAMGQINFAGYESTTATYINGAGIRSRVVSVSPGVVTAQLGFQTNNGVNIADRVAITAAGRLDAFNGLRVTGTIQPGITNGNVILDPAIQGTGEVRTTGSLRVNSRVLIDNNTISTVASNDDLEIDPNGTGTIDLKIAEQTTVGAAGAANALPATPSTYFKIKVNGVEYVVPAYAVS
jgi:hypothetical protein